MPKILEYLADDGIHLGEIQQVEGAKYSVTDEKQRSLRIAADRVLYIHEHNSLSTLSKELQKRTEQVDVLFLWEALRAEGDEEPKETSELARIYFDQESTLNHSAVFRALFNEKTHFRRRGTSFIPRSQKEIMQTVRQREVETNAEHDRRQLLALFQRYEKNHTLVERILRFLRGQSDPQLLAVLDQFEADPHQTAFDYLVKIGAVAMKTDLEVLRADLKVDHPENVVEYAASIASKFLPRREHVVAASFTIDDSSTQEVDDALSVTQEGDLYRVDIDIADVAKLFEPGDEIDREALRRSTTLYLPTGTIYMLPKAIGCGIGSLIAGEARHVVRTTVWFNEFAEVMRWEIRRAVAKIQQRLDYDEADRRIASTETDSTTKELQTLHRIAQGRKAIRRKQGALDLKRIQWKLTVSDDGQEVHALAIDPSTPSRLLVAEMMILANELGALYGQQKQVPLIFRTQDPPTDPLPQFPDNDPTALYRVRGLIKPATLSLHPKPHYGLGLSAYAQVSSPLRRYSDLIQQRQICAHLEQRPLPYDAQSLLPLLVSIDQVEQESKKIEFAVEQRWALEYLSSLKHQSLVARIAGEVHGGYRIEVLSCGAQGLLVSRRSFALGDDVEVEIDRLVPRRGILRTVLRSS